jgi:hypothetical protein
LKYKKYHYFKVLLAKEEVEGDPAWGGFKPHTLTLAHSSSVAVLLDVVEDEVEGLGLLTVVADGSG